MPDDWMILKFSFTQIWNQPIGIDMVQVHANMAHAKHAAVNEQARWALKEELSNEYQLYHYVRFLYIIIPGNILWDNSIWSPLLGIEKKRFWHSPFWSSTVQAEVRKAVCTMHNQPKLGQCHLLPWRASPNLLTVIPQPKSHKGLSANRGSFFSTYFPSFLCNKIKSFHFLQLFLGSHIKQIIPSLRAQMNQWLIMVVNFRVRAMAVHKVKVFLYDLKEVNKWKTRMC